MNVSTTSPRPARAATIASNLVSVALLLAVLFAALWVVSVGVGVARGGESLLAGDRVSVPVELEARLSPGALGPRYARTSIPGDTKVHLGVPDPTTKEMLLSSAMDAGPIALVLGTLWLLHGLAFSVTVGDPFGAANVRRLRRLGYLCILGALAVEVVNANLRKVLVETSLNEEFGIGITGFEFPGNALLVGLAALVLAEVFAHGVRLREDVEATI